AVLRQLIHRLPHGGTRTARAIPGPFAFTAPTRPCKVSPAAGGRGLDGPMKIQRFLRNTFVAVLLLLLVPLLLVQGLRAWAKRDPDALAALAVMDQVPGPHEGRNGYTDLLYAELDIPEDEREAAFAAEVAAYQRWFDSQGQRMLADA